MDFIDQLKQFAKRVEAMKDIITTEEATKTSIIMPFFSMLGYDVFNPQEFVPEYVADVGIKKGEKVDYAIIKDGAPVILIECKSINETLEKHDSQLFRYFGTSDAKFAILTNGIQYRFFTDLEQPNKMDETPFLEIDILSLKESQVSELKKFSKSTFEVDTIFDTASVLKYENEFKRYFSTQLEEPSDDFVRLFLQSAYSGVKTQAVIEKFRPVLKTALQNFISETMNDKIKSALGGGDVVPAKPAPAPSAPASENEEEAITEPRKKIRNIVTTEEELESYFIIKNMLKDIVPMEDITYKDTESYFNILYRTNSRKWICRLRLTDTQMVLMVPDADKNVNKYQLENLYDLLNYRTELEEVLKRFLR